MKEKILTKKIVSFYLEDVANLENILLKIYFIYLRKNSIIAVEILK